MAPAFVFEHLSPNTSAARAAYIIGDWAAQQGGRVVSEKAPSYLRVEAGRGYSYKAWDKRAAKVIDARMHATDVGLYLRFIVYPGPWQADDAKRSQARTREAYARALETLYTRLLTDPLPGAGGMPAVVPVSAAALKVADSVEARGGGVVLIGVIGIVIAFMMILGQGWHMGHLVLLLPSHLVAAAGLKVVADGKRIREQANSAARRVALGDMPTPPGRMPLVP